MRNTQTKCQTPDHILLLQQLQIPSTKRNLAQMEVNQLLHSEGRNGKINKEDKAIQIDIPVPALCVDVCKYEATHSRSSVTNRM